MRFWAYLLVGIAMLSVGAWHQLTERTASHGDQRRCEQMVRTEYADDDAAIAVMLPKCTQDSFATMMEAHRMGADMQSAAESISAANRQELLATLVNFALIGAGIGAIVAATGIAARHRKRPRR